MPSHTSVERPESMTRHRAKPADRLSLVDWSTYATAYDLLSEHNPEYQALLCDFEAFLATIETPRLIYDIGGGTGNFTQIASRACPGSEIRFVEPNAGMIGAAKAKLTANGNIRFDSVSIEDIDATGTADLVICVHALYTMPAPEQRIGDLRRLLRPGGWLYLVDLGRYMDVAEWRTYLFSNLRKEHGLFSALRILWQGREIAKQNKAIFKAQKMGTYWTHTEAEIALSVTAAGFEIVRQQSVYRGYSDLLTCRANP